jgi:Cys-rich four helix bundle protein (predicted Tat secretion target)
MNRRDVFAAGAALAALSTAAQAQMSHDHHDAAAANPLFDTAGACVAAGLVCMDHCLQTFVAGDTSLAACAREVDLMLSTCGTLAKLASLKSSHLPESSPSPCAKTAKPSAVSTPTSTPHAKPAARRARPAPQSARRSRRDAAN